MMKSRNLGALVALGALTALPACSMFGGSSAGSSGQYSQNIATPPNSYPAPASDAMGTGQDQTVAPVTRGMVRNVQTTLKQNGDYSSQVDGVWGPMTEAGLRKWQQAHNLNANGEIDVATLQSMNIQPGSENGEANNGASDNNGNPANANGAYQANGNGSNRGNAPQPSGNNDENAPANGNPNYNTAGTHPTGNYTSNNDNQPANMPHPTDQGNPNNNPTPRTATATRLTDRRSRHAPGRVPGAAQLPIGDPSKLRGCASSQFISRSRGATSRPNSLMLAMASWWLR